MGTDPKGEPMAVKKKSMQRKTGRKSGVTGAKKAAGKKTVQKRPRPVGARVVRVPQ